MEHLGDLLILVSPSLPRLAIHIAEIEAVARPHPHLVSGTRRHAKEALEFSLRLTLPPEALRDIRAYALARPTHLIGKRVLLNLGELQTGTMDFQRQLVSSLEHFELLEAFRQSADS